MIRSGAEASGQEDGDGDGERVPVVIVGAGPAGLSTGAALHRHGVQSVLLDASEKVGDSWRTRYDRLHLHTHRRWSGLAHQRLPSTLPRYPSKDEYADWLHQYAAHFRLDVRTRCPVHHVSSAADGGWRVEAECGTWRAPVVVIATGLFRQPVEPDIPGRPDFRGTLVHASRFRSEQAYPGGRALVVGIGNSGGEIAAELARADRWSVELSVRTPPPIRRRDIGGLPSQLFGIALTQLGPRLANAVDSLAARTAPDLGSHGLGRPGWKPFLTQRPPVIDTGFVQQVQAGRVTVRPPMTTFTSTGAVFDDGSEQPYDLIVMATGYRAHLEEFLDPRLVGSHGRPGPDTRARGIFFVGFDPTMRGQLYEIRLRSLRVAREAAGRLDNRRARS